MNIVAIIVGCLIFLILLWVILQIAYEVDQHFAEVTYLGEGVVTNKKTGTRNYLLMGGEVLIPQSRSYCSVSYRFRNVIYTQDVSEQYYSDVVTGQRVSVYLRQGKFTREFRL